MGGCDGEKTTGGPEKITRKEDEVQEKEVQNNLEEVEARKNIGEMLSLSLNHPQNSYEDQSLFLIFLDRYLRHLVLKLGPLREGI